MYLQQTIRGKAILVVDDEPDVAEVLVEIFRDEDYRVDTAANGEEALERLGQCSYDAIVCDIRMPRLNGPGLYRVLQRCAPELVPRMLFLTGDTFSPETQAFLQQTLAPALDKPFVIDDILKAIQRIIRKNALH
jgi:CheY-like chemotaxis protein